MSKTNGKKNGRGRLTNSDEKPLTPKEILLVDALTNPFDDRTKEEKMGAAGYTPGKYVYELIRKPRVAAAIKQRCDELITSLVQLRRYRVIKAVADRAEARSSQDARTFLQISEDLVNAPDIHVTQVQVNDSEARESRKDRIAEHLAERGIATE